MRQQSMPAGAIHSMGAVLYRALYGREPVDALLRPGPVEPGPRSVASNFRFRLDLRGSPKVRSEHSARVGKDVLCG